MFWRPIGTAWKPWRFLEQLPVFDLIHCCFSVTIDTVRTPTVSVVVRRTCEHDERLLFGAVQRFHQSCELLVSFGEMNVNHYSEPNQKLWGQNRNAAKRARQRSADDNDVFSTRQTSKHYFYFFPIFLSSARRRSLSTTKLLLLLFFFFVRYLHGYNHAICIYQVYSFRYDRGGEKRWCFYTAVAVFESPGGRGRSYRVSALSTKLLR